MNTVCRRLGHRSIGSKRDQGMICEWLGEQHPECVWPCREEGQSETSRLGAKLGQAMNIGAAVRREEVECRSRVAAQQEFSVFQDHAVVGRFCTVALGRDVSYVEGTTRNYE